MADFEIIDNQKDLERLSNSLLREKSVAFDTEADSFYHYFDKTCLVQVATPTGCYLIDPLAMGGPANLAPLAPVFASPDVQVIFHAAEYDLFVLKRDCGFAFANVFDTMLSAQMLGYSQVGLAALIEHHFGIKLAKDEQRSDWSRRPLSQSQLSYAASDVLYLIRLVENLTAELKQAGRFYWAEDEFRTLMARKWPERLFDDLGYLKIKGARKLDMDALAVLKQLYLARDRRAREIDRPAFKVIGNRTLLEISETRPTTERTMTRISGVSDLIMRRMGKELLEAVEKGSEKPHGPIPKPESSGRRRLDGRTEYRLGLLKKWRAPRSVELKMDPGVLCSNASLETIAFKNPEQVSDFDELPGMKRWFVGAFGEEIVQLLGEASPPPESSEPRRRSRRPRGRRGGGGSEGEA